MCYSDTHCTLSDEKNKCEFTIPGVFGFCVCDSSTQPNCPLKGQEAVLAKPSSSAGFKYPFNKPDLKKKVPFLKRPWQTADQQSTTTTTTTTTVKLQRPLNKPQMPPLKRPILKTNTTHNGIKTIATIPMISTQSPVVFQNNATVLQKNVTFKPQLSSALTPSLIKFYLKSPLKDSHNKNQTIDIKTPAKVHKKPINSPGKSTKFLTFKGPRSM